jgi:hypothetical protein
MATRKRAHPDVPARPRVVQESDFRPATMATPVIPVTTGDGSGVPGSASVKPVKVRAQRAAVTYVTQERFATLCDLLDELIGLTELSRQPALRTKLAAIRNLQ